MVVASAAKSAEVQAREREKDAQQNQFGKPSPFPLPQREPMGGQPQRESYLAIRAIETLLENTPERKPAIPSQPTTTELIEAVGAVLKSRPDPVVNVHLPKMDAPIINTDWSSMPPAQVTVNVPEQPPAQITVNVPPPAEFDIEPIRDPKTKLVTKFKRTRKKD